LATDLQLSTNKVLDGVYDYGPVEC